MLLAFLDREYCGNACNRKDEADNEKHDGKETTAAVSACAEAAVATAWA